MTDFFKDHMTGLDSPARNAAAITPSDETPLANTTRAIYIGTGGDLSVVMQSGGLAVTFPGVPDGSILPVCVDQVNSTGTTASDLVGMW